MSSDSLNYTLNSARTFYRDNRKDALNAIKDVLHGNNNPYDGMSTLSTAELETIPTDEAIASSEDGISLSEEVPIDTNDSVDSKSLSFGTRVNERGIKFNINGTKDDVSYSGYARIKYDDPSTLRLGGELNTHNTTYGNTAYTNTYSLDCKVNKDVTSVTAGYQYSTEGNNPYSFGVGVSGNSSGYLGASLTYNDKNVSGKFTVSNDSIKISLGITVHF